MDIKTVFTVSNGESYKINAVGQDAVKAIRKEFPKKSIRLEGFTVDKVFIPVYLG